MLLIDKQSNEPIYEQIIRQYKTLIVKRVLKADDMLPSVRKLSFELSVNPNTLQKAYGELEAAGICYSEAGKGRFVSKNAREIIKKDKAVNFSQLRESVINLALFDVSYDEIVGVVKRTYDEARVS